MTNHIIFLKENEPLELAHLSTEAEVIVIVPSEQVLLLEVELPPLKGPQFRQALPFALEEQLAEDITKLHFVTGEFSKNQKIPVAVVAKSTLEKWLAILKEANVFPKMLIPDIFTLPFNKDERQLRFNNKTVSIRQDIFNGFSCDADNLLTILHQSQVKHLHIHYCKGEEIPFNLQNLMPIQTQLTHYSSEDFYTFSEECTENFPIINLLQGDYKPSQKSNKNYKWRWAACAVLLILTGSILLCSKMISLIILNKELAKDNQAITKIYKNYFPHSIDIIAPRMRLEEKLKKLSPNHSQSVFLYLLQVLGNELSKGKSIQLNSFNFESNQLTIMITTTTFNDLDYFIKKLQSENLKVKQLKVQDIDKTVTASLLIQRGLL